MSRSVRMATTNKKHNKTGRRSNTQGVCPCWPGPAQVGATTAGLTRGRDERVVAAVQRLCGKRVLPLHGRIAARSLQVVPNKLVSTSSGNSRFVSEMSLPSYIDPLRAHPPCLAIDAVWCVVQSAEIGLFVAHVPCMHTFFA